MPAAPRAYRVGVARGIGARDRPSGGAGRRRTRAPRSGGARVGFPRRRRRLGRRQPGERHGRSRGTLLARRADVGDVSPAGGSGRFPGGRGLPRGGARGGAGAARRRRGAIDLRSGGPFIERAGRGGPGGARCRGWRPGTRDGDTRRRPVRLQRSRRRDLRPAREPGERGVGDGQRSLRRPRRRHDPAAPDPPARRDDRRAARPGRRRRPRRIRGARRVCGALAGRRSAAGGRANGPGRRVHAGAAGGGQLPGDGGAGGLRPAPCADGDVRGAGRS